MVLTPILVHHYSPQPFDIATNNLTSQKNPTLQNLLAVFDFLFDHLDDYGRPGMDSTLKRAAEVAQPKLSEHYGRTDNVPFNIIATCE